MNLIQFAAEFVQFTRYQDQDPLFNVTNLEPFREPISGIDGYFYNFSGTLIIFFQGSNEWRDWKTNLWFWKKRIPTTDYDRKFKAHQGYVDGYQAIKNRIHQIITELNVSKILVIGLSMGAGIAPLCADDIFCCSPNLKVEKIGVVLFGAPRCLNRSFTNIYNQDIPDTYNVMNGNDVVPRLPSWLFGFRHVGQKIQLRSRHWWHWSISDHAWENYYQAIQKLKINGVNEI